MCLAKVAVEDLRFNKKFRTNLVRLNLLSASNLSICLVFLPSSSQSTFLLIDFHPLHFRTYDCFWIRVRTTSATQGEHLCRHLSNTPKAYPDVSHYQVSKSDFAHNFSSEVMH